MSAASQVSQQNARRFALVARATIGRDSTQHTPTREQAMQFWHSRRKNRSRTRRHHRVAPSAA